MKDIQPLTPVYTAELFPGLAAELVALLRGLDADDWLRPTLARSWRVRDVAGHLLDVDLRKLAGHRDGHRPPALRPRSPSFTDILRLINSQNAAGVSYADRLSPRIMTDLLEVTGRWVSDFVATLPPDAEAPVSVLWAGEDRSPNWMDTGREYTERWHHQMQIRDAVGAPSLLQPRWFHPVLELSVQAFRRAYSGVPAGPGTSVVFEVDGDGDHAWSVTRGESGWVVARGRATNAAAGVRAAADTAWRLLFNALSPDEARACVAISGDVTLAEPMLAARSVMV